MRDLFIREIALRRPFPNDDYPFDLPVVKHLERLTLTSPVTFLAGENGAGKSTLLEAVAVNFGFNAEGGSKNFHFSTAETHSVLSGYTVLAKGVRRPEDGFFLRAESFYNLATEIERIEAFRPYGGRSLHAQSHGESFIALMTHRFWGNGLYLMDEPEAALSPTGQLAVLRLLSDLVKSGSQCVISSHSPILMAFPGAQIFVIGETGIRETPYEETEHYQVTKQFLNAPEQMLRELFRD
ncbi:MAG: AAA family ATPase [Peptococcaceae bacterium]|nr:AAA family ATPase [Peptococcaceae bacterium]